MASLNSADWIDVTVDIRDGMLHWPGDHDVQITKSLSIPEGGVANVTYIQLSAHTGTHVHAPLHFIDGGKDITTIALKRLMGKVKVIEIHHPSEITIDEIKNQISPQDQRLIFKTRNSKSDWFTKEFNENFVYLATDAAEFLKDKGILTIGIDYLSIAGMDNGIEVHRILLGEEIFIIEGLDLRFIEAGDYEMICLPLKIQSSDGSPARVLLKPLR